MSIAKIFIILFSWIVHAYGQSEIHDRAEVSILNTYENISPLGKYRYNSFSYKKTRSQAGFFY